MKTAKKATISSDQGQTDRKSPTISLPPLTKRQAECLEYIVDYFLKHGVYPTQKEIITAMKFKSTTAEMYLEPLRRKGYLQRKIRGQSRNIRTTPKGREAFESKGIEIVERRKVAQSK